MYLIIYGFFLVAFGLAFFQMFRASEEYPDSFEQMFLKMFTMVLGEIELMKIPFYPSGWMRIIEYLFFTVFLILMVLVLQNLLNALAIKDTENMLKVSEEEKLYSVMELTNSWEFFQKSILLKRWGRIICGIYAIIIARFFEDVLKDFPDKKIHFPIFHKDFRNDKIFVGFKTGEKPEVYSERYWQISVFMWTHVTYFFRFFEFVGFYRGLFSISKRMAQDCKEIIALREQRQEVDNFEGIIKVSMIIQVF